MKVPDNIKVRVFDLIMNHLSKAARCDPRKRERLRAATGLRNINTWVADEVKRTSKG
jgi:hypothetical protein